jgi:hypothetical protein
MTESLLPTVIVFLPAIAIGVRARRHGRRVVAVGGLALLAAAGTAVCGVGLVVLAFNGYLVDSSSPPAQTLGIAIPILVVAAVMLLGAWLGSGRRYPS